MEYTSFLSYCWADNDSSFVEEIDSTFIKRGVQLKRDIRDTGYKDSLKEFMSKIKISDAVIMIISNSYLRSRNCMYEVLEVYKDDNFKDKIFPIILPETKLYNTEDQIELYNFWKSKYEELEQRINNIDTRDIGGLDKELLVLNNIKGSINDFVSLLKDLKVPPYDELKTDNFQSIIAELPFDVPYIQHTQSFLHIDKSKHLLDQTYDAINQLYHGIDFFPLHLLAKQYPFSIDSKAVSYYDFYTLHTNNDDLYFLFEEITKEEIEDLEICRIENFQEKIDTINDKLIGNRIFHIAHHNRKESISLRFEDYENKKDVIYLCESYSFTKCYKRLNAQSSSLNELLRYAYAAYRICEYILSAEYLLKAYSIAEQKGATASLFICLYNLDILKSHLLFWVQDEDRGFQLISEIEKLEIKKQKENLLKSDYTDYINWIEYNLFYHSKNENLHNHFKQITNHYYSQIRGGRSINSNIQNLSQAFDEFIFFLQKSYLFFEHFSNFENIASLFTEGVLASHAISKQGGSRLEELNDFHVLNIIDYAKTDDIIKYVIRYNLSGIKYGYKNKSLLKVVIDNFFTSSEEINKNVGAYNFSNSFWRRYSRIFSNILTILSLSEIDASYPNSFARRLINFLEKENILTRQDLEYVLRFFRKSASHIDIDIIYSLLSISFVNEKYHDRSLRVFDSISKSFKEKDEQIILNEAQFAQIKDFLQKYYVDKSRDGDPCDFVELIASVEKSEHREQFQRIFLDGLLAQFNFEQYYQATINGIIEYDSSLYEAAENQILNIKRKEGNLLFLGIRTDRDQMIGQFINLGFSLNKSFHEEKYNSIRSFDKYYEWLLDLDSFDYTDFEPLWVTEYRTTFYYARFYQSQKLKFELEKILNEDIPTNVKEAYLNIYVSKTWERNIDRRHRKRTLK